MRDAFSLLKELADSHDPRESLYSALYRHDRHITIADLQEVLNLIEEDTNEHYV